MNPLCINSEVPPEENPAIQQVFKIRSELQCSSEEPSPSTMTLLVCEVINCETIEAAVLRRAKSVIAIRT